MRRRNLLALLFTVSVCTMLSAAPAARQSSQCETPLGEGDLKQLLSAGVSPTRMRQLIASCGIDLGQPDFAALEARIRQLGAPTSLGAALLPPDGAKGGMSWTAPVDRRPMVYVEGGRFQMGSPPSEANREPDEVLDEVTIGSDLWFDVAEVTNAAYRRFVLSRPEWQKGSVRTELADQHYLSDWDGTAFPVGSDEAPVRWVSWHAARAYAAWAGKRLPSEAEWEFAARAGTSGPYWWGATFDPRRVAVVGAAATVDEARYRTNPWGLADMIGGVWEWTSSVYRAYPYSATDGREDARDAGRRTIRGGASANAPRFLRVANRNSADASATSDLVGFRCVR